MASGLRVGSAAGVAATVAMVVGLAEELGVGATLDGAEQPASAKTRSASAVRRIIYRLDMDDSVSDHRHLRTDALGDGVADLVRLRQR